MAATSVQTIATRSFRFILRYFSRERQVLIGSLSCLVIWAMLVCTFPFLSGNVGLFIHSAVILIVYATLFFSIAHYLRFDSNDSSIESLGCVVLYCFVSLLLILLFALGWAVFRNFGPSELLARRAYVPNNIDALYFACVGFSTVGFGDLVPINPAGKLFLSFQALLSSVHLVAFFAFLLTKRK